MARDVKTARRVLEIFEYFAERQTPASLMEIAKTLGYPQSSASALLHSLVDLGYLDHDRLRRLYAPNARLALVGNWVHERRPNGNSLYSLMEQLRAATGETVLFGIEHGPLVQYAFVLDTERHAVRWHIKIGTRRSMVHAAVGQILLAYKPIGQMRLIVTRLNAENPPHLRVDPAAFEQKLKEIRRKGYAVSDSTLTPEAVVFAMMLPKTMRGVVAAPSAIGVGGPVDRLKARQAEILELMQGTIACAARGITMPPAPTHICGAPGVASNHQEESK